MPRSEQQRVASPQKKKNRSPIRRKGVPLAEERRSPQWKGAPTRVASPAKEKCPLQERGTPPKVGQKWGASSRIWGRQTGEGRPIHSRKDSSAAKGRPNRKGALVVEVGRIRKKRGTSSRRWASQISGPPTANWSFLEGRNEAT